jgi:hypothetical protein
MGVRIREKGAKMRESVRLVPRSSATVAPAVPVRPRYWDNADEIRLRGELAQAVADEVIQEGVARIAVIVPVLSRPQRVLPLVSSFRAATAEADARIYFVAQHSDTAEVRAIRDAGLEPLLVDDGNRSWAKKINRGFEQTTEPWLLLGADDLRFHRGWVDRVRELLVSHPGVIGTNDLGNRMTAIGTHSTHPLVRRLYAKICGTADERAKVVHEGYDHNFPDTELGATARGRSLYVHRSDCIIEHLHPTWGKGKTDAVYSLGMRRWKQDQALYKHRGKQFGW